jgi:gliding motility-associated-like protein
MNRLTRFFTIVVFTHFSVASIEGANYYWVGGAGAWSDLSHWATASGGAGRHTQLPGVQDDVFFDANSFNGATQTVTIDVNTAICRNMDWSGAGGAPRLAGDNARQLHIYGGFTLIENMEFAFAGEVRFQGGAFSPLNRNLRFSGHAISGDIHFRAETGQWILLDALTANRDIYLEHGTLNTNNQDLVCRNFNSVSNLARRLSLTRSVVRLRDPQGGNVVWNISPRSLALEARNATLEFMNPGAMPLLEPGLQEYQRLIFNEEALIFGDPLANLRVDSMWLRKDGKLLNSFVVTYLELTPGREYQLGSEQTFTINDLVAEGACEAPIIMRATIDGLAARLVSIRNLAGSYLMLRDLHNVGATTFTADRSADLGNNQGWNIIPLESRTLYWVNGPGEWYDPFHWDLNSGGPGGTCPPTPIDDVFFDANSFNAPNQLAGGNLFKNHYCRDMTWDNTPAGAGLNLEILQLFGSLAFATGMTIELDTLMLRANENGNTLLARNNLLRVLTTEGAGEWRFDDTPVNIDLLKMIRGTLHTNGQELILGSFLAENPQAASLLWLDDSRVVVNDAGSLDKPSWLVSDADLSVEPGGALIRLTHPEAVFATRVNNRTLAYPRVKFSAPNGAPTLESRGASHRFQGATFIGDGRILGDNDFGVLAFSPGRDYELESGRTQTIAQEWRLLGNPCQMISVRATASGVQASARKAEMTVDAEFVRLRDIQAGGGAAFLAAYSEDLGNNAGWIFEGDSDELNFLGPDRALCANETIELDASAARGASYLWQDGATDPRYTVTEGGLYSVDIIYTDDCRISEEINIRTTVELTPNLGPDQTPCAGQTVRLDADLGLAGAQYTWQDGREGPVFEATQSGAYEVRVELDGCVAISVINLNYQAEIPLSISVEGAACEGETATLRAESEPAATLSWNTGASGPVITTDQAGEFIAIAEREGCRAERAIVLEFPARPLVDLGPDREACDGESVALGVAAEPGVTYTWNTGAASPEITVRESGVYRLLADRSGCIVEDDARITFRPSPAFSLGGDALLCEGETIDLFIPVIGDRYVWSDGSDKDEISVAFPGGLIWGEVTLEDCTFRDSIHVDFQPRPSLNLGADTTICAERPLILNAGTSSGALRWSTGATSTSIRITEPGLYWAELESGGCRARDSIVVRLQDCVFFQAYFPNAFSPNGDGVNDTFHPFFPPGMRIERYQLTIFDRWGNQLFQSANPDEAWDGRRLGQALTQGVYIYFLDIEYEDDGGRGARRISGDVTLLR